MIKTHSQKYIYGFFYSLSNKENGREIKGYREMGEYHNTKEIWKIILCQPGGPRP